MNYEEVLGKFLQSTLDTAEKVGEFAVAQLPDLIQQALNWYFAYGLIQFVLGIALVVFAVVVDMRMLKIVLKEESDDLLFGVYGVLGMLPRLVVWVTAFTLINLQWLKIWIAPKLWLIEYASKLVTK